MIIGRHAQEGWTRHVRTVLGEIRLVAPVALDTPEREQRMDLLDHAKPVVAALAGVGSESGHVGSGLGNQLSEGPPQGFPVPTQK